MEFFGLVLIGIFVGMTTVLFGFGGGFVAVPIITLVDSEFGSDTARIAAATSALVMLVNAIVATVSTKREMLGHLSGSRWLLVLLFLGGGTGAWAGGFVHEGLLSWGFVVYVTAVVIDLLLRPGFFRRGGARDKPEDMNEGGKGISAAWGFPIGVVASFLGVGGSVLTVPMMRRSGASMTVATTLANPLTLVIMIPAVIITLTAHVSVDSPGIIGSVDLISAAALLIGAVPVIVILRRRVPRVPAWLHSWGFVVLLLAAGTVVALS